MLDRYYSEEPVSGERASLSGAEAHHLINVMRVRQGEKVILFDGSGWEFQARVERVGRNGVDLSLLSREEVDRELGFELTLAVALPKGERQKWLVEKAVELGVSRVVPLWTQRSVAQPIQQALDRLRRAVIEASKQCGRNWLMEIAEPMDFSDYIEATRDRTWRWLAHPYTEGAAGHGQRGERMVRFTHPTESAEAPSEIFLAVGPEGGFTGDEAAAAAKAGWQIVDLGPRTLRVETAAIVLAAIAAEARGAS
jgi:16S rRNA (uracil1498-N3)-methyltransferase